MSYAALFVALLIPLLCVASGLWCGRCLLVGLRTGIIPFPGPGEDARRDKEPLMFGYAVAGHLAGTVMLTTIGVYVAIIMFEGAL